MSRELEELKEENKRLEKVSDDLCTAIHRISSDNLVEKIRFNAQITRLNKMLSDLTEKYEGK